MAEPKHSFETINGCKISLRRAGKGEPLLFLHGAGGGHIWFPFMAALSERYEVFVPEHPGFGPSDTPEWLDTVGDLAFFYLDFMEQFGLRDVHLMGASLGGWTAAEVAVRNTSRLKTVTLVSAAGIYVKGVPMGDMFLWPPEEGIRHVWKDPKWQEKMLSTPQTEEQQDLARRNRLTTAKLAWQPRWYNPQLRKWLHRIDVPTHIVWGDADGLFPAPYAKAYQELIPGSTMTMLSAGHIPQVEQADEFVEAVTSFIGKSAS